MGGHGIDNEMALCCMYVCTVCMYCQLVRFGYCFFFFLFSSSLSH